MDFHTAVKRPSVFVHELLNVYLYRNWWENRDGGKEGEGGRGRGEGGGKELNTGLGDVSLLFSHIPSTLS